MAMDIKFDRALEFFRQSYKKPLSTIEEIETSLIQTFERTLKAEMETISFPQIKSVLWDHSEQTPPVTIHITQYRCLKIEVSSQILRLSHRHLTNTANSSYSCLLIGSVKSSDDGHGVTLKLDKFDMTGPHSSLPHTPGDLVVPFQVYVSGERKDTSPVETYTSSLKTLSERCRSKAAVDTSAFVSVRGSCSFSETDDGVTYSLQFDLLTPATQIAVTLINPVPIVQTALSKNLAGPLSLSELQGEPKSGYLTMDHTRKLLLVLESDPKVYGLPLVGMWVSGAEHVYSMYVWASCLRYLYNSHIQDRVCAPPEPFLLILYSPLHSRPQFYDVSPTPSGRGLDFSLHTALHSAVCPQTSDTGDVTLESCVVESGSKSDHFDVALYTLKQALKSLSTLTDEGDDSNPRKSTFNADDIIPRIMPFPQPSKMPIKDSQVPEVSIFFQDWTSQQKQMTGPAEFTARPTVNSRPMMSASVNGHPGYQSGPGLRPMMTAVSGNNARPLTQNGTQPTTINSMAQFQRDFVPQMMQQRTTVPQMMQRQNSVPQMMQQQNTVPQMMQQRTNVPQMVQQQNNVPQMVQQQNNVPQMMQQQNNVPQMVQQQNNVPQMVQQQNNVPQMMQQQNTVPQMTQSIMRSQNMSQSIRQVRGNVHQNIQQNMPVPQRHMTMSYTTQQSNRFNTNMGGQRHNVTAQNSQLSQQYMRQLNNPDPRISQNIKQSQAQQSVTQRNPLPAQQASVIPQSIIKQPVNMMPNARVPQQYNNTQSNQLNVPQFQRMSARQNTQQMSKVIPQQSTYNNTLRQNIHPTSRAFNNDNTNQVNIDNTCSQSNPSTVYSQGYRQTNMNQSHQTTNVHSTNAVLPQHNIPTSLKNQPTPACSCDHHPPSSHTSPPHRVPTVLSQQRTSPPSCTSNQSDTCRLSHDSGLSVTPERPSTSPTHTPPTRVATLADLRSDSVPSDVYQLLLQQDTQLKQLQAQLQQLLRQSPPTSPPHTDGAHPQAINQARVTNSVAVNTSFRAVTDGRLSPVDVESISIQTSPVKANTPQRSHGSPQHWAPHSGYGYSTPNDGHHTGAACVHSTQNLEVDIGPGTDLTQIMNDVAIHERSIDSVQSEIMLDMPSFTTSPTRTDESHNTKSPVSASMVDHMQNAGAGTDDQMEAVSDKQFYNQIMTNIQTLLKKQKSKETSDGTPVNNSHDSYSGTSSEVNERLTYDDGCHTSQYDIDDDSQLMHDSSQPYTRYWPDQSAMDTTFIPKINYVSMFLDSDSDTSLEINALAMKYLRDEQLTQMAKLRVANGVANGNKRANLLREIMTGGGDSATPNITQYGMSGSDMSMATQTYMMRHGLITGSCASAPRSSDTQRVTYPNQKQSPGKRPVSTQKQGEVFSSYLDVMPDTPHVHTGRTTSGRTHNPRNSLHSDTSTQSSMSAHSGHSVQSGHSARSGQSAHSRTSVHSDDSLHSNYSTNSDRHSKRQAPQTTTASSSQNDSRAGDMVLDIAMLRQLPKLL